MHLKRKKKKNGALKKLEEIRAKGGRQKAAAATGKAKAAAKTLVKVAPAPKAVAKATAPKAAAKAASKAVADGGSRPDDSLVYRGPAYAQVRYYKDSTIYHDAGNHQWRVKPIAGSRQTIKKSVKTNPKQAWGELCLLYTSPSPRDLSTSRMPSSA